jgi:hypothetical protein
MRRALAVVLWIGLACATAGCGDETQPQAAVAFLFEHRDAPGAAGQFVAVTSDPAIIAAARKQLGQPIESRLLHPDGPIARGGGGHNPGWGWHFVPGQWRLVEASIELCDGTPALVEADLDYWIDTVGGFCPWTAYVAEEL